MNRKTLVGAFIAVVETVPLLTNCATVKKSAGDVTEKAVGVAIGLAGKCPDLSTPESILALNFAQDLGVSHEEGVKLRASTAAAVQLKDLADRVDAALKLRCGNIAKDLGAGTDFKDGHAACEVAAKAITNTKAKIGANAKLAVVMETPKCAADMQGYRNCAVMCGSSGLNLFGGSTSVGCEPGKLAGKCDAKCEGACDVEAGARCDGTCSGSCDAAIRGTCSGKCTGKCDDKNSRGAACAGTCDGKCDGTVQGACKGNCGGECKIKASGKCEGTCMGKCSAEFKEPKCTGEMKPPYMRAECKAYCDAEMLANLECTQARVGITATGVADAKAFEALKMTLEKNLPTVLKVSVGLGERMPKMAKNAKAIIQGTISSFGDIHPIAGVHGATISVHITMCLADTYKGAIAAAAGLQANVIASAGVLESVRGSLPRSNARDLLSDNQCLNVVRAFVR
ncbi:MAG: hypothetical protein FWD73_16245 [Polyangiaceae bacterium]|nr:hypothetical protein [Polyangiaceae bacterium]